jgi:hypothetical protein
MFGDAPEEERRDVVFLAGFFKAECVASDRQHGYEKGYNDGCRFHNLLSVGIIDTLPGIIVASDPARNILKSLSTRFHDSWHFGHWKWPAGK